MPLFSSSTVLQLVDSIATVVSQAYRMARVRLTSTASPIIRMMVQRDHAIGELELLRRELDIFRSQRETLLPHRRPDYHPSQRLAILQLRRLRGWSIKKTARYFVVHPNTLHTWIKAIEGSGRSSLIEGAVVWNRIDDVVRWTVHELRRLCPEPECGTRAIARHIIRAGIDISRSTVQRILRERKPSRPPQQNTAKILDPMGEEPHHLLKPLKANRVWHMDLTQLRVLWYRFTVVAILDGYTRKLLCLSVHCTSPKSRHVARLVRRASKKYGRPRFIITDHGPQFRRQFRASMKKLGVQVVQGRVRAPYLNGKMERLFRTFRLWWRWVLPGLTRKGIQRQLDNFRHWYNDFRPHSALQTITPNEAWEGHSLPRPIPIRTSDAVKSDINIRRLRCRGDPRLPVIEIAVRRAA